MLDKLRFFFNKEILSQYGRWYNLFYKTAINKQLVIYLPWFIFRWLYGALASIQNMKDAERIAIIRSKRKRDLRSCLNLLMRAKSYHKILSVIPERDVDEILIKYESDVIFYMAHAFYITGSDKKAEKLFLSCVEKGYSRKSCLLRLAEISIKNEMYKECLNFCKKMNKKQRATVRVQNLIFECLSREGVKDMRNVKRDLTKIYDVCIEVGK